MEFDPQFEIKLDFLRFKRIILLICEWLTAFLLVFMIYFHFPGYFTGIVVALGISGSITAWLDIVALETEIGVPHSNYIFFPINR